MDQDNKLKHKAVKTYTEDMTRVLESDQGGLIKKIIHEEEAREAEKKNMSPESQKNKLYMLASSVMVTAALAIFLYSLFGKQNNAVIIPEKINPILYTDTSIYLEIDGLAKGGVASSVLNSISNAELSAGGVEAIYLTENKRVITLRRFLQAMEMTFLPGDAALVSESFVLGVVNAEPKTPFILIKMRSMPDVFAPLRNWEEKMDAETQDIFRNYSEGAVWIDGIVGNKNARILSDSSGEEILMYVFADNNSVVITENRKAAEEVMRRLLQSEVKK